jgi:hypothetical protein
MLSLPAGKSTAAAPAMAVVATVVPSTAAVLASRTGSAATIRATAQAIRVTAGPPTAEEATVGEVTAAVGIEPLSSHLIYRNEAILDELYSFAVIWNPFKRRLFLLHRAALFNIDRPVSRKDCRFS